MSQQIKQEERAEYMREYNKNEEEDRKEYITKCDDETLLERNEEAEKEKKQLG